MRSAPVDAGSTAGVFATGVVCCARKSSSVKSPGTALPCASSTPKIKRARPSQQGSKLRKDPEIIVYIEKLKAHEKGETLTSKPKKVKEEVNTSGEDEDPLDSDDPLEFLIDVMKNGGNEMMLRVNAARSALPYVHGKVAEKGKKETKADEAKKATQGGKFGTLGSQLRS